MSPGYDNDFVFGTCSFTAAPDGRSNGNGPDYDGAAGGTGNPCEDVNAGDTMGVIATVRPDYYSFRMGTSKLVTYQLNGVGCSPPDGAVTVDMQYAYATSGGHVGGIATLAGDAGSYVVTPVTAAAVAGYGPANDCGTGTLIPMWRTP